MMIERTEIKWLPLSSLPLQLSWLSTIFTLICYNPHPGKSVGEQLRPDDHHSQLWRLLGDEHVLLLHRQHPCLLPLQGWCHHMGRGRDIKNYFLEIFQFSKKIDKKNLPKLFRWEGGGKGRVIKIKLENNYFRRIIQFSEKIDKNICGPNFFDPKLTQPKLFQTERTRFTHLLLEA